MSVGDDGHNILRIYNRIDGEQCAEDPNGHRYHGSASGAPMEMDEMQCGLQSSESLIC